MVNILSKILRIGIEGPLPGKLMDSSIRFRYVRASGACLCVTQTGGELRLVRPYVIEMENLCIADSKCPIAGLNTSRSSLAGRALS